MLPICALYLKNQAVETDDRMSISYENKQRHDELIKTLTHTACTLQDDVAHEILDLVEEAYKTMTFDDWEYVVELLVDEIMEKDVPM